METEWKEVVEERYDDQLGVVPPAIYLNHGFLVGEPTSSRLCTRSKKYCPTFRAFMNINGRFYEGPALTVPEFRALVCADVEREATPLD
ncbi:hypothetical protein V1283_008295 [Bradyrhizobium sp. AZCC 2262]